MYQDFEFLTHKDLFASIYEITHAGKKAAALVLTPSIAKSGDDQEVSK